jgi:hypothetical protein
MRSGSVRLFEQELLAHRRRFMQSGVYLLLEKLQPAVVRRLFKRVYERLLARSRRRRRVSVTGVGVVCAAVALCGTRSLLLATDKIPLKEFRQALLWQGVTMDLDEVECVLANMIAKVRTLNRA